MCLARGTTVDLHHAQRVARRVLASTDPARLPGSIPAAVEALSVDLLPGWYDDWAQLEAEEWRQLRLHALETLAGRLITAGRHAEAVSAAHAAVHADPLRESGQTRLLQAHLAEGNRSEALHAFRRYSRRLHEELGWNRPSGCAASSPRYPRHLALTPSPDGRDSRTPAPHRRAPRPGSRCNCGCPRGPPGHGRLLGPTRRSPFRLLGHPQQQLARRGASTHPRTGPAHRQPSSVISPTGRGRALSNGRPSRDILMSSNVADVERSTR
ncbi:BTAD domain-containing putative transcriptional regulator [Streptomyces sp. NPDC057291]|uniref:AfsR/SARP family transcriptional regulator n=1 Tax=Streptomyces sp. NPDC057291 TaxID=3346087 RepID=UPI003626FB1F